MSEGTGKTTYAQYHAPCPDCGLDAEWLTWADQDVNAEDQSLHLRVNCQRCRLPAAVSA